MMGDVTPLSVPIQSNVRRAKGESGCTQNYSNIPSQSLPSTYSYFLSYFLCVRASVVPLQSKRVDWEHKLEQILIVLACYFLQGHLSPIVKVGEQPGSPKYYRLQPYYLSFLFSDVNRICRCGVCVCVCIRHYDYINICIYGYIFLEYLSEWTYVRF